MKTKLCWSLPWSCLAFALASCGGGDDTDGHGNRTGGDRAQPRRRILAGGNAAAPSGKLERSVKVEIVDFAYNPDPVQVETGGKVIWQNMDSAPHTATADDGSFDTGTLEEGKLKSETFKKAGTYTYFCEIHPTMHGTVEVIDKE